MITNMVEAIQKQAQDNPAAIAYDYLGKTATYRDLDFQSDRLAAYLQTRVTERNRPIMVFGSQTFEMIVAFLAINKIGNAYIPVDIDSSEERIASILETAEPAMIIEVELLGMSTEIPVLHGSELDQILTDTDLQSENLKPVTGDENFYIIFTSGTTGNPKGVQISNNNLTSFVNWMIDDFDFTQQNVLEQPPYSFDLSVMALYPTLVCGKTLKILPKQVTDNFKLLFIELQRMNLSTWISTPSLMNIVLMDANFNEKNYPNLNQFLFCGEELPHRTAAKLVLRFPNARVFNTYGPTETTVAISSVQITDEILTKFDRLPIGRIKGDMQVLIDTESDNEPGEIIIKGPAVSKGYLNNTVRTMQVFQAGSYYTGDIGVFDQDLLMYKGRTDFQIKLNGYRIELEEINQSLSKVSNVKSGVAVPKYDRNGRVNAIEGVIVLNDPKIDHDVAINQIRRELQELLMPYMIPARYQFVNELPTSLNGKVDIKAIIKEVNGDD